MILTAMGLWEQETLIRTLTLELYFKVIVTKDKADAAGLQT